MIKYYRIKKIITHDKKTRHSNGIMIPIWKDYDAIKKIKPRFIYVMTCAPKSAKGPYSHIKRRGLLTLLQGKIIFVYKNKNYFKELYLDARGDTVTMIDIPKGIGYLVRNPYLREAQLLNICDYPWKKSEQETLAPDFSKYFKRIKKI